MGDLVHFSWQTRAALRGAVDGFGAYAPGHSHTRTALVVLSADYNFLGLWHRPSGPNISALFPGKSTQE
ncbi:Flavin oxidoreductase hxnT [Fusarium oxysporum f. sp. albedinis]|nr:Flavin oxidoreductase hxnT [Fusarium oxysporum f. sp. albedinis]